uniref:Uncharacterized protein n=1 Tax=Rhizophora mucronata TaxID=61149 RepID=A0A2P2NFG7_RHIMU
MIDSVKWVHPITYILILCSISSLSISFSAVFFGPFSVKDVVLQLRPLLTKKKLLVSIAAGVKLKDLEVSVP